MDSAPEQTLSNEQLTQDPQTLARGEPAPAPACTFVIMGAGGDLTKRLLMPAMYNLSRAKLLDPGFAILGCDRVEHDDAGFRHYLGETMQAFLAERGGSGPAALDGAAWEWLQGRISYLTSDFGDAATFARIKQRINGSAVFYLATSARFFAPIIDQLHAAGLMQEGQGVFRRVVIEKPFGHDLASARALNTQILAELSEDQVYRIDHYLGKETVQNIMALRFSNGIFEPLWKRDNIDHVQITAAETVGVETRGAFFETTGTLRDMVPNHVMQLLAMTAMEAPNSFDADAVRTEKAKVIQAIHPMTMQEARDAVVPGQYSAGTMKGHAVPGYRAEANVDPRSMTETYVAMKLRIDNWRWAGVPFYIRTGKRLAARKTEIAIHFKQAPFALFRDTPVEKLTPNMLILHIQPSEGATLQISAKIPGPVVHLGGVKMKFDYGDYFKEGPSTGYETLLYDCLIGDPTLFQRADNIEAGWAAVQPMLDAWAEKKHAMHHYEAGSQGPAAADALLARDGRHWLDLAAPA